MTRLVLGLTLSIFTSLLAVLPFVSAVNGSTSFCELGNDTTAVNRLTGECELLNNSCVPFTHIKVDRCPEPKIEIREIVKEVDKACPETKEVIKEVPKEVIVYIEKNSTMSYSINYSKIMTELNPEEGERWYVWYVGILTLVLIIVATIFYYIDNRSFNTPEQYFYSVISNDITREKRFIPMEEYIKRKVAFNEKGKITKMSSVDLINGKKYYWSPRMIKRIYRRIEYLRYKRIAKVIQ